MKLFAVLFFIGSIRWFILEGIKKDDDVILFGIVIGLMEDEYGYISLNELSNVELDMTKEGLGANSKFNNCRTSNQFL